MKVMKETLSQNFLMFCSKETIKQQPLKKISLKKNFFEDDSIAVKPSQHPDYSFVLCV
jgi:hypothetical protein